MPGIWELREAIASLYNRLYRRGLPSQYSAENVSVSGGGRAALTRAAASLGTVNLGHFLPDYTAYEELLDIFKAFTAIPILLEGERGYGFSARGSAARGAGPRAVGAADVEPLQPHRQAGAGRGARTAGWRWRASWTARCCWTSSTRTTSGPPGPGNLPTESAARYVEDVDRDPVVLFDGLTKNWRYPGWRVTWTVGPQSVIETAGQRRVVPGRRRQPAHAAGGHPAGRRGPRGGGDPGHPPGLPGQARPDAVPPGAHGRALRPAARGDVLRLGQPGRPARRR